MNSDIYNRENLYSPAYVKDLLSFHNIELKQSLGQNFLLDQNSIDKIVNTADISSDDVVLEIGPGIGHLTAKLLKKAKHVIAVEIDQRFIEILTRLFGDCDNFTLIHADILKVDVGTKFAEMGIVPNKIVANVPYYITTPILTHLFESDLVFESVTITLQKELAVRYVAQPHTKAYGSITVVLQYWGVPKVCGVIPASCFFPQPKIDSSVLNIQVHPNPPVGLADKILFQKIIRMAFSQRRKMLRNTLKPLAELGYPLEEALEQAGILPTLRAENLSLQDFANLTEALIVSANQIKI